MTEYLVNRLHIIIFSTFDLSDSLEFARTIRKTKANIFDGEPVILPVPEDAPTNIPRVFLNSKDDKYHCGVAPDQLQISFLEPGVPKMRITDIQNRYLELVDETIGAIKERWNSRISRLNFIIEIATLYNNAIEILKDMYIKEGALKHPNNMAINYSDTLDWDETRIRASYRIYAGQGKIDDEEEEVISLLFNIDTMSEEKHDFNKDRVLNLVNRAFIYISENAKVLLPHVSG